MNDVLRSNLLAALFPDGPLRIAADARITENDRPVSAACSLLVRSTAIGAYRIVARDLDNGQVGFCGQLWFGDEAALCGGRLHVVDGALVEAELIHGPSRFPGATGVDTRTLGTARPAFSQLIPATQRLSRARLVEIAAGYYAAVNRERPELALLDPAGARVEAGTRITGNPAFRFEFYQGLDGQTLPNFGAWSAREQFERGLWNADRVPEVRYPVVEPARGLVVAFMTYFPWGKRGWTEVTGVGRVGPFGDAARRVALNAMEVFRIADDRIKEMESVWSIEPGDFRNSWAARA